MPSEADIRGDRPAGVVVIGIMMVAFGGLSILIAGVLVVGVGSFDDLRPVWLIPAGGAVGLVVFAFFAVRVGLGLIRGTTDRREGERALWYGIPAFLWALWAINLWLTGGANDVTLWFLAPLAVLGLAGIIGAAFYMRSQRVRSYFDPE